MRAINRTCCLILVLGCVTFVSGVSVVRADLYVYPTQGQSQEQQQKDRFECHTWAVQQTGFDPSRPAQPTTPPPTAEAPRGGAFRGAARGAAIGATAGAIGGSAGKGAARGAAVGGMVGGMRRHDQRRRQQQEQANWQAQQQAAQAQGSAAYDRALSACLSGRGYTVQ